MRKLFISSLLLCLPFTSFATTPCERLIATGTHVFITSDSQNSLILASDGPYTTKMSGTFNYVIDGLGNSVAITGSCTNDALNIHWNESNSKGKLTGTLSQDGLGRYVLNDLSTWVNGEYLPINTLVS